MRIPALIAKLPTYLSRETSGGKFIPQVDGLRFIAILTVFLYHVNGSYLAKAGGNLAPVLPVAVAPPLSHEIKNPDAPRLATDLLSRIFAEGYFGVQLFFVISGMIIATPFAAARLSPRANEAPGHGVPSLKKYLFRRVTRLEPPYIINLLICYVVASLFARDTTGLTLPHLLASMGYVHYFVYGASSTINAVAWSLEIEIQFYLLAPLVAYVFAISNPLLRRGILAGAILAAGAAVQSVPPEHAYNPGYGPTILSQFHWFLVGFLLADVLATVWKQPPATRNIRIAWDLAGAAAWIAMGFMLATRQMIHVAGPFLIFIAYAAAFRGVLWPWFFSRWFIYTVGGMCYTIYLYHMLVIVSASRATFKIAPTGMVAPNLAFQAVALGGLTLAAGGVLFALFERPFMKRDWHLELARKLGFAARPATSAPRPTSPPTPPGSP